MAFHRISRSSDEGLTLETSAFQSLYGGQFTLSTPLINLIFVNNKDALEKHIRYKKNELENIIQYKTKGAIIRSKARWYNEGEKNSKYFLNLENRHWKRKTITQIKTSNGSYATNDTDILKECNSFYSRLYTSRKPRVTSFSDNLFFDQEHPSLNNS